MGLCEGPRPFRGQGVFWGRKQETPLAESCSVVPPAPSSCCPTHRDSFPGCLLAEKLSRLSLGNATGRDLVQTPSSRDRCSVHCPSPPAENRGHHLLWASPHWPHVPLPHRPQAAVVGSACFLGIPWSSVPRVTSVAKQVRCQPEGKGAKRLRCPDTGRPWAGGGRHCV